MNIWSLFLTRACGSRIVRNQNSGGEPIDAFEPPHYRRTVSDVRAPMSPLRRWLREPLLHFLLAGAAIFLAVSALAPSSAEGERIAIGRAEVLAFMQGRAQVYDSETFEALLDAMPENDREKLVRDAALQEALYREGESLDLASADPLVRQRVVQQMRSLVIEQAAAGITVTDEEVAEYFLDNRAQYARPPAISFEHVFVRDSEARAGSLQARLAAGEAGIAGDRFAYQRSYADASPSLLESQFGANFAQAVFGLPVGEWSAPIRSDHGWHLVRPSASDEAVESQLQDVAAQVRQDALAAKRQVLADRALDEFLSRYQIDVVDDLTS